MNSPNDLRPVSSAPFGGPQSPHSPDVPVGQPVTPVDWFRRMPNGGTVYFKPA